MTLPLTPQVARFLAAHHVMTLASNGADGPWAAAVFYARNGDDLIFLSSPTSRHVRQLVLDARCAATIQSEIADWRHVQGIQLEGQVAELDGSERTQAQSLYAEAFPFIRPAVAAPAISQALARVRWYRLRVARLFFIDNARGFGQRVEFEA